MKINNLSFPYPVLGIGDDILPRPSFKYSPEILSNKTEFIFKAEFDMKNATIHKLVNSGYAKYICEVTSRSTFYRKCFTFPTPKFVIQIPKNQIGERVFFQFTITIVKPISDYSNPNFHEDYHSFKFDLEPGDLLGFLGEYSYDVDIKYDKLKSVGTFMQITEGPTLQMPRFNFENSKIDIQLPTRMYNQYRESIMGNTSYANIIHSSLVFNALVTALLNIKEFKNTLWARTILFRVATEATFAKLRESSSMFFFDINEENENNNMIDTNDVIELAQLLLVNPYARLFDTLLALNDSTEED